MFSVHFTEETQDADLEVLFVANDEKLHKSYADWDKKSDGLITKMIEEENLFDRKFNNMKSVSYHDGRIRKVLITGIGDKKKLDKKKLEALGAKIYQGAKCIRIKNVVVGCDYDFGSFSSEEAASYIALGMKLASYKFDKYRTTLKEEEKVKLEDVNFVVASQEKAEETYLESEALIAGIYLARDLVTEPANHLYPATYAERLEEELEQLGIGVTVLCENEMRNLGMGALLGVGQGSAHESKLVVMEYYGAEDKDEKPIAFVGKGVTFDTGGISIKPSANMWEMKYDMGGSAAVSGTMKTLAIRRAKVNAVGVIGLVENMPGGSAQRPSDVVKTMSGKTAEVIDTDAEGRLVLADALWYTQNKFSPKFMIDLATLTGAIVIALGSTYAGLFSNDDELSEKLKKAGENSGEEVWRMPLHKDFENMIKSEVADVRNLGNIARNAGSSTAAEFLKHFVNDLPWAHLDIAGMAWEKTGKGVNPKGAVGFGVKLLNQLVKDNYES